MRPIGFSTGALALGDFHRALAMLASKGTRALELSALRDHELAPLMAALNDLPVDQFSYFSIHVPSKFKTLDEAAVAAQLLPCIERGIPIILHPDVIEQPSCWAPFGSVLCIENMDKRKKTGRTLDELEPFFSIFPEAGFCLDIGHARQIDSTMTEARLMLRRFGHKLRQIHISEIDAAGHHNPLSLATVLASQSVADLIGDEVPVIIESMIQEDDIDQEMASVEMALKVPPRPATEVEFTDWGELA